jgi:DNA polymerase-1
MLPVNQFADNAMTSNKPCLVLVDGSSFLFRAYHAVPPLTNAHNEPTNAIYGVANMLRKLLDDHKTRYFAVVFDAPGKNFRHELYPDYKANRPPMPEDLRVQIDPLHQLIRNMGLPLIMESGVEADDVLATLADKAVAAGLEVVISTGDKDMAQVVSEHIILENTMSGTRMDVEGVFEKFGVRPDQIVDYLALMGDSVDNIPGVPKVGPKTAAKWLSEYQTLENLLDHAKQIKGKVGENLRDSLDFLPRSKQLTTIDRAVKLNHEIDDLVCQPADRAELRHQLEYLGFSAWLKALDKEAHEQSDLFATDTPETHPPEPISQHYETVFTLEQFQEWLERLKQADLFAFDTETTSLDYIRAEIVGVSFAIEPGKAAYVPLAHDYPGVPEQLNREQILAELKPLLENPQHAKVGQNLKYDMNVLAHYDIHLQGVQHDTMLESYVLNSTATAHNMDDLAQYYLGYATVHFEDIAGKGVKQLLFSEIAIEQAAPYAAEDADITLRLHQALSQRLQPYERLQHLYQNIEIPLLSVLSRMERQGVLLDEGQLAQQSLELAGHINALEHHAHELAGKSFNLGSPKQIQEILYNELQLPVLKKTPKGQPSTNESVLQELALDYPLPAVILEFRSLSKLKSTYTDKLPQQINPVTGRVHTSYHQAVTATGRLSSSDPNLQNIPIRTAEGRKIRQAFIAPAGYKIMAADYSQIELRIMAHLSADSRLIDAFKNGEDVHRSTAAEVFGVQPDQVTHELRRSAKAINFGLIYGMSAFGLAKQLGINRTQAQSYIDLYFARYTGVKDYMDRIRQQAHENGYVETLLGRRLYLPDLKSRNKNQQQFAERTAINAPMQGTAADIIKIAMIRLDQWLQNHDNDSKMIMQVHDELVFEVPSDQIEPFTEIVRDKMSSAASLAVHLEVDIGVGNNWDEAH